MNDYYKARIEVKPCTGDITDLLAAFLAEDGFESFEPDETGLTAYAPAAAYDKDSIARALASMPMQIDEVSFACELIPGRDWNKEWEQNYFQPIVVDNRCVIHSTFHANVPAAEYDIVIDPKMAFGTGHHATTTLIIKQLLSLDLRDKSLIDMGTGTGILAILAAMRGAKPVTAIEIDEFAYVNACENVALNGCSDISVMHGDASLLPSVAKADMFLANINRNIITGDMNRYVAALNPDATVLFSGFYTQDVPVVREVAEKLNLTYAGMTEIDNWACVKFSYKNQPL